MGLKDVAGVFSRKFIIGFFIPAFFVTFALAQLVDQHSLPSGYRTASGASQTLIIGAFAILIGLLLSGLHYSLLRFLEGYWLIRIRTFAPREPPKSRFVRLTQRAGRRASDALDAARRSLGRTMRQRWIKRREHLVALTEQTEPSPERTAAAMELHRRYPAPERMLPTEFGNAIRSFETHPRTRYGLDGIAVWPRISSMLSESERDELENASTDVAFWVNSLILITVAGSALFVERLWHPPATAAKEAAVALSVAAATALLGWFMYRQAITAAIGWGDPVRAAFDVHRLQLYQTFGVRVPETTEEEKTVGFVLGRLIWFGEPIPDELRAPPPSVSTGNPVGRDGRAAGAAVPPTAQSSDPRRGMKGGT